MTEETASELAGPALTPPARYVVLDELTDQQAEGPFDTFDEARDALVELGRLAAENDAEHYYSVRVV